VGHAPPPYGDGCARTAAARGFVTIAGIGAVAVPATSDEGATGPQALYYLAYGDGTVHRVVFNQTR